MAPRCAPRSVSTRRAQTVLYAPTYSPASSLHHAGETIVRAAAAAGWNVIVKLHDRSLDPDPRYSDGIDWRARMRALEEPGRICYVEGADASPVASRQRDAMITDHSSVGFEYLVLDRPLIVFDAPGLAGSGAHQPRQDGAASRSAAHVVSQRDVADGCELRVGGRPSVRTVARAAPRGRAEIFHDPGGATARAVSLVIDLLGPEPLQRAGEPGWTLATRGGLAVSSAGPVHASVLIPTYNRAALLDETLTWLARDARARRISRWDVIVIDNNSSDGTRTVVERHAASSRCRSAIFSKGGRGDRAR